MATELKPCRYCKKDRAYLWGTNADPQATVLFFCVCCGECSAQGPKMETEQEAIDAWNQRDNEVAETLAKELKRIIGCPVDTLRSEKITFHEDDCNDRIKNCTFADGDCKARSKAVECWIKWAEEADNEKDS